jgi:hypothetical protein
MYSVEKMKHSRAEVNLLLPPVCWRLLLLRPATTTPPAICLVLEKYNQKQLYQQSSRSAQQGDSKV